MANPWDVAHPKDETVATPARSTPLSMWDKAKQYGKEAVTDIAKSIPSSFARASAGLAGLPQEIIGLVPESIRHDVETSPYAPNVLKVLAATPDAPNLGNVSLSGLKQILGGAYHEPETTPGKIADFAVQNALMGAKSIPELASKNALKNLGYGASAGAAGELVPDDMPKLKMAAQVLGGFSPSVVEWGLRSNDRATINAAKMIKQAMEGKTSADWAAAEKLVSSGKQVGVPLMGPEGFKGGSQIQQLASDVGASPAAGAKIRAFTENRADQAQQAVKEHIGNTGADIGLRESANQAETAATKVITNAEHAQTQGVKPFYDAASKNKIPETAAQSIIKKIDDAIAEDKTNVLAPKLRELRNALTESKAVPEKRTAMVHDENGNLVSMELPEMPKAPKTDSLIKDIAKAGGIKESELADLGLTKDLAKEYAPGLIKPKGGRGMDGVMEWMQQNGWLSQHEIDAADKLKPGGGQQLARDLIMKELAGDEVYHPTVVDAVGSYKRELNDWEHQYGKYSKTAKVTPAKPEKLVTDIENLDRARKYFRDKIELPTIAPDAIPKEVAAKMGPILADIRKEMMSASKSFAKGKALYETIQKTRIDPLMKGPVGNVAGKGADAQREATYSRVMNEISSPTATPERIGKLADELKSVDKTAFPNVVRAYLESELSSSMKDLQGRKNPMAGANFRNAIEGTPQEKKNIRAMIQKVAEAQGQDPVKVYQGFGKLLDVLDATGRVPGIGSQTQSRMENAASARSNPFTGAVDAVSTHPLTGIGKWLSDMYYKKTYGKLADVFTSPESVKKMKVLADLKTDSPYAKHLVSIMLTSGANSADNDKSGKD